MPSGVDCIVVGAGIAGASLAWHLSGRIRAGRPRILVLEREIQAGTHATAQNAAMVRGLSEDELSMSAEGVRFWNDPPPELGLGGAFRRVGSLLLASTRATLDRLGRLASRARQRSLACELWPPERCRERLPVLADTPILGAVFSPDDGVGDPATLVESFLREARRAGVGVRYACRVDEILKARGAVRGLRVADGEEILSRRVVIAAGAWAGGLLERAGAPTHGLTPYRRHLFQTAECPLLEASDPFVWHLDLECYFRPEAGGILFSACDETEAAPGRPEISPEIEAFAQDRLRTAFPFLLSQPIRRCWAGLRTFAEPRRLLVAAEARPRGLFSLAGLGGSGVTCAAPAGRLAAELLFPEEEPRQEPSRS
ncbi:MAG: NAD(P)/FAD-dependent oxidoreductase [Planctomycetota bacterium]